MLDTCLQHFLGDTVWKYLLASQDIYEQRVYKCTRANVFSVHNQVWHPGNEWRGACF